MKKWAFILLFGLVACNTEKKALEKTQLYLFKHPEFSAGYCAEQFRVPTVSDSTQYKEGKRIIDSLANELLNSNTLNDDERSKLMAEIERIRNSMPQPETCDSLRTAMFVLINKEKLRGDKLQSAYNNLLSASRDLKPIHDTIQNRAEQERLQLALYECQKNAGLILQENNNLKTSLAIWRKTAKIRWWWIALLIGGFVGTIAVKVFGKSKLPI